MPTSSEKSRRFVPKSSREREVMSRVRDGWFMGGLYEAKVAGCSRTFEADSPIWLWRLVMKWLDSQKTADTDDRLLVRCVAAI